MSEGHEGTRMGRRRGDLKGRRIEPPPPEQVERAEDAVKALPWEPTRDPRVKVLFMVANSSTAPVNAEVEEREIQDALGGKRFVYAKVPDVRAEDLFRSIRDEKPEVVHFSGHGTGSDGLAMKNRDGNPTTITARELGLIFKDLAKQGIAVRAVLLNACLAEEQAKAIAPYVDNVVGTSTLVGDDTAVTFAGSFYQSIVEGRTVRAAFEAARTRCGGDVEGTERIFRLFYSEPVPPIPEPSWKKFAILGLIANAIALAAWLLWPDDADEAKPDAGPPDAAAAAPALPVDAAAPDAKPPVDASVKKLLAPDPVVEAPEPDAAQPRPTLKVNRRMVKAPVLCARSGGRNMRISRTSCCVGSIPVSPAQEASIKGSVSGCTKAMICQSIAADCR